MLIVYTNASSRPLHSHPTINPQDLPIDPASPLSSQETYRARYLLGRAKSIERVPARNRLDEIVTLALEEQLCARGTRGDAVDGYLAAAEVFCLWGMLGVVLGGRSEESGLTRTRIICSTAPFVVT
jgi:hypothetical protein